MATTGSAALGMILEKIASKDKDFRYMATSDLLAELTKETFRAAPDVEKKVCAVVLKQLDDQSGDVSSLAIKCLPPLVKGASERASEEVITGLCAKLAATGKDQQQQRDVGTIGLKTVVADLGAHPAATRVVATLAPKLTAYITSSLAGGIGGGAGSGGGGSGGGGGKDASDISGDCLDILNAMASGYGALMTVHHQPLKTVLFAFLAESGKQGTRKRAVTCLATLSASMSDALLAATAAAAVQKLAATGAPAAAASPANQANTALYVQLLGAMAKTTGYRFGKHVGSAHPLVAALCRAASDEKSETLREQCLQTLELFACKCPTESAPLLPDATALALELLSHDPNFTEDDEDEEMEVEEDEDDDDDDDDEEDEYSDDEDTSWKVRRAATRLLSAIVTTSPATLEALFDQAVPRLLSRLREREESVKLDIFATLEDVLRTAAATRSASPALTALAVAAVPALVRGVMKQFKARGSSPKTKTAVFGLLRELASSFPGALGGGADAGATPLAAVVPSLQRVLAGGVPGGGSNLRVEALAFTRLALESHPPAVFQPHVDAIAPPVFAAAGDRYYKVAAEAMRVCSALVPILRPGGAAAPVAPGARTHVVVLVDAALARVAAADQDQEVKEAAITCVGVAAAALGDAMGDRLGKVLGLLLERLGNEITRLAAIKAITLVAQSSLLPDLAAVAPAIVKELATFLRKANRPLRQASLTALDALVVHHAAALRDPDAVALVSEAASLVSDSDMALASLALALSASVVRCAGFPDAAAQVCALVLPAALGLVRSPLMQKQALSSLQAFFAALVSAKLPGASFEALLSSLMDPKKTFGGGGGAGGEDSGAAATGAVAVGRSAAKCVAAVCASVGPAATASTVATLIAELETPRQGGGGREDLLALLCLGELGRRADLSSSGAAADGLEKVLLAAFDSPGEELKSAASFALGGVAAGNQARFLPVILNGIGANPKRQYNLLLGLREVIHALGDEPSTSAAAAAAGGRGDFRGGVSPLGAAELDKVLKILFAHSSSDEEGVRNVVAECLGRLTARDPAGLMPELRTRVDPAGAGRDPNTRMTAVTAAKYAVLASTDASLPAISDNLRIFVGQAPLTDEDRGVRRAAVQTLSAAAHARASLVLPLLPDLLPILLEQTVIIKELIRVVDLGPFKHTVDDGLDLRKAAFECCDTLLHTCLAPGGGVQLEHLNAAPGYLAALGTGLGDHYDIKMVAHQSLAKLCAVAGPAVLAALDSLVDPMGKTLTAKLKSDAVKQEIDRNEDLLRSCLRAVVALEKLEGAADNATFTTFLEKRVTGSEKISPKYAIIKAEAKAGGVMGDEH